MTCDSHLAGRWFLFGLGLVVSFGKIKFWIFPNLDNEKLGFLDSFKPFYSFEYRDSGKGGKGKKKRKEKEKDKGTDGEKVTKETEDGGKEEVAAAEDRGEGEEEGEEEGDKESEDAAENVPGEELSEQTEQIAN